LKKFPRCEVTVGNEKEGALRVRSAVSAWPQWPRGASEEPPRPPGRSLPAVASTRRSWALDASITPAPSLRVDPHTHGHRSEHAEIRLDSRIFPQRPWHPSRRPAGAPLAGALKVMVCQCACLSEGEMTPLTKPPFKGHRSRAVVPSLKLLSQNTHNHETAEVGPKS
jgi:hypothetical protein